jgi:pimeloyl-ACP methyl ester carboxylesterase
LVALFALKNDKFRLTYIDIRYCARCAALGASMGKSLSSFVVAAFCFAAMAAPAMAQPQQELTRRGALGVQLAPGEGGVRVVAVTPSSTADRAGLRADDVLTAVNGVPTPTTPEAVAVANSLRAGDRVQLAYRRGTEVRQAQTRAVARPLETYTGAQARYGAMPFQGGLLRDILVTPDGAPANGPVLYFIQGYYCATIEGATPDNPYRALVQGLAARGIATYRVEKPGMGDSLGGPQCLTSDFTTELAAFRAGLTALTETYGVDPSRIVLFGHSMGGLQAPLLAAETGGLRGVAVMGTVVRSWHDYMIELMRVQSFFSNGMDPADGEELSENMRPLLDRIFNDSTPLATIAEQNALYAGMLSGLLNWDGGEQILFRDVSYWRQIGGLRLARAWRGGDAPVLAMYGESDFAAIDARDHQLIVDIVNHYRPGTAQYVFLPRTGHGFGLEGTRAEAQAANQAAGGQATGAPFNPEVARVLADWIEALPAG